MMSDKDAAEICRALNHPPAGVYSRTPEKHRFECSCGYQSTYRRTFALAVEAGIVHMRKVAAEAVKNGRVLPSRSGVAV